ncbi:MAG: HDOD domain-containing protein [Phycisphaerae bacterium]
MSIQSLDHLVEQVKQVPRLPDTAMRLVSVLGDPGSSVQDIVETIRYDQTVTAEILRLCNSAYFGLARRVNSLDEAIRLLGTAKVLQLAMSAQVQPVLNKPQEGYGLAPGSLWEHSVAVALGCRDLARRVGAGDLGLSFTLGLLHDVGKVVLNEYVAAEYVEIVRRVSDEHMSFLEAEQSVLGFTHTEAGARLAEVWSLPEVITKCIRYHHDPDEMETPDALVDCVHLANTIGMLMGVGGGAVDGLAYRASPAALERQGLGQRDLETIGADIVAELRSVRQLFAASK